jgi:alpha-L-fucosidase
MSMSTLSKIAAMITPVIGGIFVVEGITESPRAAGAEPVIATEIAGSAHLSPGEAPYQPSPANLTAREWFQDVRFGVFVHWGVYSVLGRGEWVMHREEMTSAEYEKLPVRFNPTRYDPAEWVSLFKRSGANYVTITARHGDGFAMWDSKVSDWDIVDRTPYRRDVLRPLAEECRRQGMKLFFYYSHLDWHHPDYYPRGTTGQHSGRPDRGDWDKYIRHVDAQLAELLSGEYGDVAGIWFDGWWDQQSKRFAGQESAPTKATQVDWHLRRTYDLIHSLQPACLIGNNHHVAPFAGEDFQMFERDLPGQNRGGHSPDAVIGELPLETCDTINRSWGYNASDHNYKSVDELVRYLVRAAGRNANLLLNVGPRPDGTIDPEMARRLEGVGEWISRYGHTIRGTRGGPTGDQAWGTSTQTEDVVYLHVLDRSSADNDGWLTLTGTESLKPGRLCNALSGAECPSRRSGGVLQVKTDGKPADIDVVLSVANN